MLPSIYHLDLSLAPWSIAGNIYGSFHCSLFDLSLIRPLILGSLYPLLLEPSLTSWSIVCFLINRSFHCPLSIAFSFAKNSQNRVHEVHLFSNRCILYVLLKCTSCTYCNWHFTYMKYILTVQCTWSMHRLLSRCTLCTLFWVF
jgi:hypothetical protein